MKFDELDVGKTFTTDSVTITKKEIIEFGKEYDPQYFHVDECAAKNSLFGTLVASGFQTLLTAWTGWINLDILGQESLGGNEASFKWLSPVFPNDELSSKFTVLKKKTDRKRGLITFEIIITNQKNKKVLTGEIKSFLRI